MTIFSRGLRFQNAVQEEELLRRRFRLKGLQLVLKEEMSAVNKKIDVRMKVFRSQFAWHLLCLIFKRRAILLIRHGADLLGRSYSRP